MIYTLGDRRLVSAHGDYYVAPSAELIGSVTLGRETSVWFNCVLRADSDQILIGDGSNIQDASVIHVDEGAPCILGANVSIGHAAMLHSCSIGDNSLIANGALVLDNARIGRHCVIAAGALVPPGKVIPDRSMVMGSPGKVVREVTEKDLSMIAHAAAHYRALGGIYRSQLARDLRTTS